MNIKMERMDMYILVAAHELTSVILLLLCCFKPT